LITGGDLNGSSGNSASLTCAPRPMSSACFKSSRRRLPARPRVYGRSDRGSTPTRAWIDDARTRRALATAGYFYQGPLTETRTFSAAPAELAARRRPFIVTFDDHTATVDWKSPISDRPVLIRAREGRL
jgi:hypothetical protein